MRESGNIAFLRKKACAEGWEGGGEEKVASDSSIGYFPELWCMKYGMLPPSTGVLQITRRIRRTTWEHLDGLKTRR
jgi:hypothetical protein